MTGSARQVLKIFSDCAYHIQRKEDFQAATQMLYGDAFIIQTNLQKRMVFYCDVCKKEMNCTSALADHSKSGRHQKNVDKLKRCDKRTEKAATQKYRADSLQYKLITSCVKAIGLQMVEEFKASEKGKSYFKCNLCGAHGFIDAMYLHLIGPKHTDRYIKKRVENPPVVMSADAREEIRQFILGAEGSRVDELELVIDKDLYPYEWIREALPDTCKRKMEQEGKGVSEDTNEILYAKLFQLNEELMEQKYPAPEDPLDSLELMFALGKNLYQKIQEELVTTVIDKRLQEWKDKERNMNKFLGLLQHVILPETKVQVETGEGTAAKSDVHVVPQEPPRDWHQITF